MKFNNNKKGNLVETVIVVVFAVFMFLMFSNVWLGILPGILETDFISDSTGLTIMVSSIPFVAFLGIIIWIINAFRVQRGGTFE